MAADGLIDGNVSSQAAFGRTNNLNGSWADTGSADEASIYTEPPLSLVHSALGQALQPMDEQPTNSTSMQATNGSNADNVARDGSTPRNGSDDVLFMPPPPPVAMSPPTTGAVRPTSSPPTEQPAVSQRAEACPDAVDALPAPLMSQQALRSCPMVVMQLVQGKQEDTLAAPACATVVLQNNKPVS